MAHPIVAAHTVLVRTQNGPRGSGIRPDARLDDGQFGPTSFGMPRLDGPLHRPNRHRQLGPMDCEEE